jgi:hypothetical protein
MYLKAQKPTLPLLGVLTLVSALLPMGLTFKNGWPASLLLPGTKVSDRDYGLWFYVKPWCRFSPYIVGILLGYILHITKTKQFKISKVYKDS